MRGTPVNRITLPLILRTDAVANLAGGVLLAAVAGWLAPHAGLGGRGPVLALAALLVANGLANAAVDRRPSTGRVFALAGVDLAFAVAVLAVAVLDPTGAEPAVRWGLAGLGDLSAIVGVGKVLAVRASKGVVSTS